MVYSVVDRKTLKVAEEILLYLWKSDYMSSKAVILVGNKADLERKREVPMVGKYINIDVLYLHILYIHFCTQTYKNILIPPIRYYIKFDTVYVGYLILFSSRNVGVVHVKK